MNEAPAQHAAVLVSLRKIRRDLGAIRADVREMLNTFTRIELKLAEMQAILDRVGKQRDGIPSTSSG